jgi:Large ribosomal RNA subunit accumulation protein YceD
MIQPAQPWHVPVRLEEVPETGLHLDLVADEHVRAGVAVLAGVSNMSRLEASLDVVRHGNGLRATGRVSATVGQTCVVTLEPIENQVDEPIDVVFAPSAGDSVTEGLAGAGVAVDSAFEAGEPPEVLSDGIADLGAIAAEFLLLGIDPYPRKPGAEFTPPTQHSGAASPFAVLAQLKDAKH